MQSKRGGKKKEKNILKSLKLKKNVGSHLKHLCP